MRKYIKAILILIFWIIRINWINFLKYYNSKSNNVIIFSSLVGKFGNEIFSWDLSAINYHIKNKINFRIVFNYNNIINSIIYWSPSKGFVSSKHKNYTQELFRIAKNLENNNNRIFPSSKEIILYENKSFMHKFFSKNNINSPVTMIFKSISELENSTLNFPIILKGKFSSGSSDIYRFNDKNSLLNFLKNNSYLDSFDNILIQEFLDIRMDLRVTIIKDEVVLFYWRKNPSNEWKPTASSYGSYIDFNEYPKKWKKFIIEEFKKTNMPMGAFDIAWDKDDLSKKPYILEFSPRVFLILSAIFKIVKFSKPKLNIVFLIGLFFAKFLFNENL